MKVKAFSSLRFVAILLAGSACMSMALAQPPGPPRSAKDAFRNATWPFA